MDRINWSEFPFVRVAICFAAGVFIGEFLTIPVVYSLAIFGVLITYLVLLESHDRFVLWRTHVGASLVFLSIFLVGGMLRIAIENKKLDDNRSIYQEKTTYLTAGKIVEKLKSAYGYKYILAANAVKDSTKQYKTDQLVVVTFKQEDPEGSYMLGDVIEFEAVPKEIIAPQNPAGFDYAYFLKTKGIVTQFAIRSGHHRLITEHNEWTVLDVPLKFRSQAAKILEKYIINDQSRAVAESLLTGSRTNLSNQTSSIFVNTGAMHVLAVSGLHVGIFIGFFIILFRKIKTKDKTIRFVKLLVLLGIIAFYVLFTGASPSVVRAGIMISLVLISKELFKKSNSFNVLSVTALGMLIYQPLLLFQASFQFSFLALISILYFQPLVGKYWQPQNGILKFIWGLLTVTLAAQVLIFPLSVYYFHQFPLVFMISSFIAIPLATVIIYLGSAMIFLAPYFEGFSQLIAKLLNPILDLLISSLTMLGGSEHSLMREIYFSKVSLIFGLIFCITLMIWLFNRNFLSFVIMLGSIVVITSEYQFTKVKSQSVRMLTIYDQYRGLTIDGFNIGQSTCHYTGELDSANIQFLTHVHRLSNFVKNVEYQNIDSLQLIQIGSHSIYNLNNRKDYKRISGKQAVDYLIVNTSLKVEKIDELFLKIDPKMIILPRGLYPKSKDIWIQALKKYDFQVYDIEASGAFVHSE